MSKIFVSGLQVQEMLSRNCDELVKAQDRAASLEARVKRQREALVACDQLFAGITPDANTQTASEMEETRSAIAELVRAVLDENGAT